MRALVTTTINPPTKAILAFAEFVIRNTEWIFIIVGDTRTPHDDYQSLALEYPRLLYLDQDRQAPDEPLFTDSISHAAQGAANYGKGCDNRSRHAKRENRVIAHDRTAVSLR